MRFLLIVNPTSAGGKNLPRLEKALRYFRKKGDEVVVHSTTGPGDATVVARERGTSGFDAVIGAGGDGTIHEVVDGLTGSGVPLGILPWGTGNVFAKEMGLPRRIKALCRVIRRGRTRLLDVGLVDGRPFLLMASAGLDAYALGRMPGGRLKRVWGLAAYALAGFEALIGYKHPEIEVLFDEGNFDRGSFVLISNTRLYGAFFVFHPHADPTDGYLDVFVLRQGGRWNFLGMTFRLFWHGLVHPRSSRAAPFMTRHGVYRTKGLTLAPAFDRAVQVDGDHLPGGAERFGIAPASVRVVLPRPAWRRLSPSDAGPNRNLTQNTKTRG